MNKIGKYIYGIIFNTEEFTEAYTIASCPGINFMPYRDIAAAVNDSEIVDYMCKSKSDLAKLLLDHQKFIEKIMNFGYLIIPMRLGTFANDEGEVRDILSKGYIIIKEIRERIYDKVELDVAVTFSDFNAVLKEAGEEKEIKELKEKLLKNPKDVTVDDRIRAGIMLKKILDDISQNYALKILDELKTVGCDCRQHETMDDKMVMNSAFLVNKDKQNEFYNHIEQLDNRFGGELNFRCVGPLPPYSFYTLEIKKMQFDKIDWARKTLGILSDSVNRDEIKKVYQRQAFLYHPDKNPGKSYNNIEFEEIKKSYDILLDYAESCEQAGLPAPRPDVFYVYAIRCNNESLYIGYTDDLRKRYQEHVEGTAAQWTKKYKPLYVAHYEEYNSREEAVKREKELKTGFGRKWLKWEIEAGRARQAGKNILYFNEEEFKSNAILIKMKE